MPIIYFSLKSNVLVYFQRMITVSESNKYQNFTFLKIYSQYEVMSQYSESLVLTTTGNTRDNTEHSQPNNCH